MPTLNWIGKEAVINHHDEVPIHTLTLDRDQSLGYANEPLGTGNLLVEGDNLTALKALLPYYAGKVNASTLIRLIILAMKAGFTTITLTIQSSRNVSERPSVRWQ